MPDMTRRDVLGAAAASAAAIALPRLALGDDRAAIAAEIQKRHGEAVQRLQEWIRQPSIAAENRGMNEGCELTMRLFKDADGSVTVSLGAKGVIELELVASGEKWGRGPKKDVHSSNRARLDSPSFHLVQALATLVTPDGDPAIDGFADAARPPSPEQVAMLDAAAKRLDEATAKRLLSADRWAHDLPWRASLERFLFTPTVNIEGLVGGYTGPGGKTVLPHRAVAKLDLRLVPDMTYAD